METFAIMFVLAVLLLGLGAVIGAGLQDRAAEGRRRRVTEQRREVNDAIRQIRDNGYRLRRPEVSR